LPQLAAKIIFGRDKDEQIPYRGKSKMRKVMTAVTAATVLMFVPIAFAQQGQLGTAEEAREMLDKAVAL
jgi:hypothetical protein